MENEIQEYLNMVKENGILLKDVPVEVRRLHPEICLEAVRNNSEALEYVPKEVQITNSEICLEAVKKNGWNLEFVTEEVQMSHPEICLEAVKKDGWNLEYVTEEVQMSHPEICLEAVKNNGKTIQCVIEEVKISNIEIYLEAAKRSSAALQYIPEEVKISHPEMCLEAVKKNGLALQYIPKKVQISYPEIFMEAVKKDVSGDVLRYVPEEIQIAHLDICLEAVKKNYGLALKYISEKVQRLHPEICLEAVKKHGTRLEYVSKEVQMSHPEICLEAVKTKGNLLQYVSDEAKISHPEICREAVKQFCGALYYVPEEVQMKYPEMCMEAVKQSHDTIKYVSEKVQISQPEICIEAVRRNRLALKDISENVQNLHPEICIEAIKQDIYAYTYINKNARENEEIKKYMFEDIERIDKIKKKKFFISIYDEYDYEELDNNIDVNIQLDIYYHKIIKSLGMDELERFVNIPELTEDEIQEYQLQYDEKFNRWFEKNYILKGDTKALIELFRNIDLKGYEQKGKNIRFEIYKNINKELEGKEEKSIKEILRKSMEDAGIEMKQGTLEKYETKKNQIVGDLIDERYDKVREEIERRIEGEITTEIKPIKRIIEKEIKKNGIKNEGRIEVEEVIISLSEELQRKNENRRAYYSPHITNQREKIEKIAREILEDEKVEEVMSKSVTKILKEGKESIGQGWIRKIQNIPTRISKEKYEEIKERLGIEIEAEYKTVLKEGVSERLAYELLAENQIPGVLTFNQLEIMFDGMKEPYSQKFREYYKQHREEILSKPEAYSKLSQMHNNFDDLIDDPKIKNRYNAGKLDVESLLKVLAEKKYDNVERDNKRLAELAAKSGLTQEEFDAAQRVWKITKKREGSAIPQVEVTKKKYRGRMLRADDELNLFVGNITTCCQCFGNVGEGAMMHSATENNGGVFVIEEIGEKGEVKNVIGQSWTWRNNGRICFDNIEITESVKSRLEKEEQEEILEIYKEAGKNAIEIDEKMMSKLLKEGKISQEVYDEVVLKEVTVGLNQYNDLDALVSRLKSGELKESEEIILPKEKDKEYEGYDRKRPWIDSREKQVILSEIPVEKRKEIEERRSKRKEEKEYEVPYKYKNVSEVKEYKGNEIIPEDIAKIKDVEKTVYRKEQQMLQECETIYDVAEKYELDPEKIELKMSKDEGWYMIGEENEEEYYIADLAMIGGVNSQKNGEIKTDAKISTFEMAEKVYEKMLEMGEKGKTIRMEATRDTSYINLGRAKEKGLIEVIEDKEAKFEDSEIDMNNMVIKPNVEKLRKELEKIKEMLKKLKEREKMKIKPNIEGEVR